MKQYIKLPNSISELDKRDRFATIAVLALIKTQIKTGANTVACMPERQIADTLKIHVNSVKKLIKTLKELNLVLDITKRKGDGEYCYNVYHFDSLKEDYLFFYSDFLYLDIPAKLKGFAIYLRSKIKNGAGFYTYEDISEFNLDPRTFKSYIRDLEEYGIIKIIGKSIILNTEYFPLYLNETKENMLYSIICDFCISKGVLPPIKHTIDGRERCLELMTTQLKGKEVNLEEKFKTLPEKVTLEYFLKGLCNDTHTLPNDKNKFIFVM